MKYVKENAIFVIIILIMIFSLISISTHGVKNNHLTQNEIIKQKTTPTKKSNGTSKLLMSIHSEYVWEHVDLISIN